MFSGTCVTLRAFKKLSESSAWREYMKDYENFYPNWSVFPEGQERCGMQSLMESSGFHVVELEVLQRCYHFPSIDTFLEVCLSGNPCLDNIPKELYGAFKEDLRRIFTRSNGVSLESPTFDFKYQLFWGVIEKVDKVEKFG
ncbi:Juvenile hormone acid O-methyltransferase [Orchesella cincta]|uniref:Juvenile hormone acid O-methyltransferase n=1 Tax=Orchesella cincta TaxID=48709 RepID=A0A1D2MD55_ORCCI|nr:Juvenile hormone acid O-methyltransferase [Orchesella cincta]